jgi:hypothetical protein
MNYAILISLLLTALAPASQAQDRIYRCGNEYTNTAPSPKTPGCKLMEGGNVTVVQGTRPAGAAPNKTVVASASPSISLSSTSPVGAPRVNATEQKSRDSDARQILESELKKAEVRQAELLREYNNGLPDKRGDEATNGQKYLDRVMELKSNLARIESDIAGIRRELGRVPAATAAK